MTTVTIKGFVHRKSHGEGYVLWPVDMSRHGDVLVGPAEFEFEMPEDFNPVAAEVACLQKKLDAINEEHANKARQIKDRIANLLCIEHSPSGDA